MQKFKPIPKRWTKVLESVCEQDLNNMKSYLFLNVLQFRTTKGPLLKLQYRTVLGNRIGLLQVGKH